MSNTNSKKRYKTCDNGDGLTWSDLNHDVLSLVMMKLGIVDIIAFSGVCNSWRSLALSDKNKFMVSLPPGMLVKSECNTKECYFIDFDRRMSKLIIPHPSNRKLVGVTRGYLILLTTTTLDLYLVNPITRHQLHFPINECTVIETFRVPHLSRFKPRVILVFSPSLSAWVLVVLCRYTNKLWYSVAGKGTWNNIFSSFGIRDVIACKGKIYTLNDNTCRLCELRLHPEPKLTLLKTKNFPCIYTGFERVEFVSGGENLYVRLNADWFVHELDFSEMKWVSHEQTKEEYTFFVSSFNHVVAGKREPWADPRLQYKHGIYHFVPTSLECRVLEENTWYFPHDCLDIDLIDE